MAETLSPPLFREPLVERGPLTMSANWQRWLAAFWQQAGTGGPPGPMVRLAQRDRKATLDHQERRERAPRDLRDATGAQGAQGLPGAAGTARHPGACGGAELYGEHVHGTMTGCTAAITGTARYVVIGKHCTVTLPELTGTSNNAATTLTGFPAGIAPSTFVRAPIFTENSASV